MSSPVKPSVGARSLAARALVDVETDARVHASAVLDAAFRRHADLDPRDRGLATELTYGVLRWRRRLDLAINRYLSKDVTKIEPVARALMRIGAYQIGFLDKIPPPIAVSATQDAARQLRAGRVTGLLNAVLRKVAAHGRDDAPTGDSDADAALRTGMPDWIFGELRDAYGADAEAEARVLRERPTTSLRPNLTKGPTDALVADLAEAGFTVAPGLDGTLSLTSGGDVFSTQAYRDGRFVAQDPASLAVVDLLGDVAGANVLDLCAGRGIKATALAERGAHVFAIDVDGRKLDAMRSLAQQLGVAERIDTDKRDGSGALPRGDFDAVLVDAPCSGLGTLRRHPEIAWRRLPQDVIALAALQERLLANAATLVKPGGRVVYAVCTFVRAEGAPVTPAGLTHVDEIDVRPSSGRDAFRAQVYERRA